LCHCLRVTQDQVREAVADRGLATVRQVTASCGAGGGCTACHRHIKRVIAEEATSLEPAYSSPAEGTLFGHNLSASVATLG
jgi:bacterioferritin-associated ferredoxin